MHYYVPDLSRCGTNGIEGGGDTGQKKEENGHLTVASSVGGVSVVAVDGKLDVVVVVEAWTQSLPILSKAKTCSIDNIACRSKGNTFFFNIYSVVYIIRIHKILGKFEL